MIPVLAAVIWGIVQGVTEFLPVSSDGHLIIIPAFLTEMGIDAPVPSLAATAVLHLGTLVAMIVYFRHDLARALRFRTDPAGRRLAILLVVGTIPAAIAGLPLADRLDTFGDTLTNVGWALVVNGGILFAGHLLATGTRRIEEMRIPDSIAIGVAQILALVPGISRSGSTISTSNGLKFDPLEGARFSFLLGIPVIAGAGVVELFGTSWEGGFDPYLLIGVVVAGITGYLAIGWLMAVLRRFGLLPFAVYCVAVGLLTIVVFN